MREDPTVRVESGQTDDERNRLQRLLNEGLAALAVPVLYDLRLLVEMKLTSGLFDVPQTFDVVVRNDADPGFQLPDEAWRAVRHVLMTRTDYVIGSVRAEP